LLGLQIFETEIYGKIAGMISMTLEEQISRSVKMFCNIISNVSENTFRVWESYAGKNLSSCFLEESLLIPFSEFMI
jgi:hypothetical protein